MVFDCLGCWVLLHLHQFQDEVMLERQGSLLQLEEHQDLSEKLEQVGKGGVVVEFKSAGLGEKDFGDVVDAFLLDELLRPTGSGLDLADQLQLVGQFGLALSVQNILPVGDVQLGHLLLNVLHSRDGVQDGENALLFFGVHR